MSGNRSYQAKLKDPRWQRLRLEKMQSSGFKCDVCDDSKETLHIHHIKYTGMANPWDYKLIELQCLCETCHTITHIDQEKLKAYVKVKQFQETTEKQLEPTPVNGCISYLCFLALTSIEAQKMIAESLAEIEKPMLELPGGLVLKAIISDRPNPDSIVAIMFFMEGLCRSDVIMLCRSMAQDRAGDPMKAAQSTIKMLRETHLRNKELAARAKLRQPDLSPEQRRAFTAELEKLQAAIKSASRGRVQ